MGKLAKQKDLARTLNFINSDSQKILNMFVSSYSHECEVMSLTDVDPFNNEGLYLLIKGGEVVYVGMTNNIFRRLGQHVDSDKVFKRCLFINFKHSQRLEERERILISIFCPKYNLKDKQIEAIDVTTLYKGKIGSINKTIKDGIKAYERNFLKRADEFYNVRL
tara:strand:- start:72 stop:563 length:492 start_codon:yes stop_codon:yes gene_type:complete